MKEKKEGFPWGNLVIILLFAITLIGFRLSWVHLSTDTLEQEIINGELDLRDWDFTDEGSVTLIGEWKFYPYQLLKEAPSYSEEMDAQTIEVPGDWSQNLNEKDESPYGYGSYQLRIYIDPAEARSFSMRIPSVRSASALYANGVQVGKSGEVGESEKTSEAWNIPYTSTSIRAGETGMIDFVLQASNYVDPRASGLVRSVKFGDEAEIQKEMNLSSNLQLITGTILFVHALFAGLIFIVGVRDKRLLYFAVAIMTLVFINLTGGDEKVLFQYVQLEYSTTFKLAMIIMMMLAWALIHTVGPQIKSISRYFLPTATVLFILFSVIVVFLPMDYLAVSSNFSFGVVFVGAMISIGGLVWSRQNIEGGIWISLAIIAIVSHYAWWSYTMTTGMKLVYYPFDLIIAIVCLAGLWFRHYYHMHLQSEQRARQLLKADKEKDDFLAATSHELRNPLHSILNMSEGVLVRERDSLHIESIKNLETVLSVSRRMSILLDELLEMTRLKEGKPVLKLRAISLPAVASGVVDMLYYKVEGKPVEIVNRIPDEFPLVMGDESRVIQILFNLLDNAVKYTPSGKVVIEVSVKKDVASISISDTGIGMDEETIQDVFKAYKQGSVVGQPMTEGGFGLGLSISKRLVELHDEELRVHSKLGEGSTFTFNLPLAKLKVTHREISNHSLNSYSTDLNWKKTRTQKEVEGKLEADRSFKDNPRIIVIDDDPVNLKVIKTILSIEDYDITTVLSGEDVWPLLDTQEWDLIVSDIMMPHISGYELTRLIRQRYSSSELPILLVTARGAPEDIESGFKAGANDYILKPVDAMELRARVNVLTGVKQSFREQLQMESAWMQAQIQPHFLFNTLNSIIALSEIDIKRMHKLLQAFSNVLRRKFNFKDINEFIPIADEFSVIRSYVYIEKERFGDRLEIVWEIDDMDNKSDLKVPSLTIQPLVENAIEHGVLKRARGGKVIIRTTDNTTHLKVSVIDDGVGIKKSERENILKRGRTTSSGIGLLNTHLRLQRLFGKGLQIDSSPGYGTIVSFIIPYEK